MKKKVFSALLIGILLGITGSTALAKENITIGSVIMNNSGDWFMEVLKGQEDAASDYGVECIFTSSDNEISKESDNVALFISKKVDALVISPLTMDASVKTIENATVNAGIPVITWNTTVATEVASHIGVDPEELGGSTGKYAAEYIEKNMPDGCNLAIIGNSSYEIGAARCEGFKNSLHDLIQKDMVEILTECDAEFQDESYEVTYELLKEYTDIQMIWCWNQISLIGCVDAVKEMGRKDVIILGTDMSVELAEEMLGDQVTLMAITTQMPYEMGYKAIENAIAAIHGETVDKEVLIPTYLYTKENPDEIRTYIEEHEKLLDE